MITYNKDNSYSGWLGNVMFQTAATIGIAIKNKMEYCFSESSFLSSFKNIKTLPNSNLRSNSYINVQETSFGYTDVVLSHGNNYNVLGYRQSEKYFKHCEDTIRLSFEFPETVTYKCERLIQSVKNVYPDKKIISLHIRCGDYLTLKDNHTCLMDIGYYHKAVKQFNDAVFLVFSDNLDMACQHIASLGVQYDKVEGLSPTEDMCLMGMTDGHIIANSSFSWWAAWLSRKKIVISPSENSWFGPAYKDLYVKDIIPEIWTQISM